MASGVEAFRSILDAPARGNRNSREALASSYVPVGQTALRLPAGEHFDAGGASKSHMAHPSADFNAAHWFADIDSEYERLFTADMARRLGGARLHPAILKTADPLRQLRRLPLARETVYPAYAPRIDSCAAYS